MVNKMNIVDEVEHEDGSATYTFEMTEDERKVMTEQGILWCLVAGITGLSPLDVLREWKEQQEDEWR